MTRSEYRNALITLMSLAGDEARAKDVDTAEMFHRTKFDVFVRLLYEDGRFDQDEEK